MSSGCGAPGWERATATDLESYLESLAVEPGTGAR